jgi:hypothetical protein
MNKLKYISLSLLSIIIFFCNTHIQSVKASTEFIKSIDTMKESKDTANNQLTVTQIQQTIATTVLANVNYIAVSTSYDFPDYLQKWADAIHQAGKHVWFRPHFNQWENDYGTTGIMTPGTYIGQLKSFILQHSSLFNSGDIFDGCAEPENGKYWSYYGGGGGWAYNGAPNQLTNEYNQFMIDLTQMENAAFFTLGIPGIETRFHSTNGTLAVSPNSLYPTTVAAMGVVVIDHYIGQSSTQTPQQTAAAYKQSVDQIYSIRKLPILFGEVGYSTEYVPDDTTQQNTITSMLSTFDTMPYVLGMNYWVGADNIGDGTRIFTGSRGNWSLRPAGVTVGNYYKNKILSATSLGYPGDTNTDSKVDGIDYVTVMKHYSISTTNGIIDGDLNGDGKVDQNDLTILLTNILRI